MVRRSPAIPFAPATGQPSLSELLKKILRTEEGATPGTTFAKDASLAPALRTQAPRETQPDDVLFEQLAKESAPLLAEGRPPRPSGQSVRSVRPVPQKSMDKTAPSDEMPDPQLFLKRPPAAAQSRAATDRATDAGFPDPRQFLKKQQPTQAPAHPSLDEFEDKVSEKLKIPRNLIKGMVGQESGGNPNAVSPKGARGRWQIMPRTFAEVKRKLGNDRLDPNNSYDNIYVGAHYLRSLYDEAPEGLGSDRAKWAYAVSRYHGGGMDRSGRVRAVSDGAITTDKHVEKVMKRWAEIENQSPDARWDAQRQQYNWSSPAEDDIWAQAAAKTERRLNGQTPQADTAQPQEIKLPSGSSLTAEEQASLKTLPQAAAPRPEAPYVEKLDTAPAFNSPTEFNQAEAQRLSGQKRQMLPNVRTLPLTRNQLPAEVAPEENAPQARKIRIGARNWQDLTGAKLTQSVIATLPREDREAANYVLSLVPKDEENDLWTNAAQITETSVQGKPTGYAATVGVPKWVEAGIEAYKQGGAAAAHKAIRDRMAAEVEYTSAANEKEVQRQAELQGLQRNATNGIDNSLTGKATAIDRNATAGMGEGANKLIGGLQGIAGATAGRLGLDSVDRYLSEASRNSYDQANLTDTIANQASQQANLSPVTAGVARGIGAAPLALAELAVPQFGALSELTKNANQPIDQALGHAFMTEMSGSGMQALQSAGLVGKINNRALQAAARSAEGAALNTLLASPELMSRYQKAQTPAEKKALLSELVSAAVIGAIQPNLPKALGGQGMPNRGSEVAPNSHNPLGDAMANHDALLRDFATQSESGIDAFGKSPTAQPQATPKETTTAFTDPVQWRSQQAAAQEPGTPSLPAPQAPIEGGYLARRRAQKETQRTAAAQEADNLFASFVPPSREVARIANDQQSATVSTAPRTIAHPDPIIDGKPVIAETRDGRLIVANPENKSGVSVVRERPSVKQRIATALDIPGVTEPVGKNAPPADELNFGFNPIAAGKSVGKALQSNLNDTTIAPGYDLGKYTQDVRMQVAASIKAGRLDPTWTQSLMDSVKGYLTGNTVRPHARFTDAVQKHFTTAFDAFNQGDGPALAHAQREIAALVQAPRHKFLADITRPLMLGTELSMVGIQAGYNLITHPVIAARAAVLGLKSAKTNSPASWFTKFQQSPKQAVTELLLSDSSQGYDEITQAIRNHAYTKLSEKAGLELDTQAELDATQPFHERTEGYASSAIRKLPLWRQTERIGKVFLDAQRLMLFEQGAKILEMKGKTFDKNPDAFQELARSVNIASGRGQFGDYRQVARFLTNFGTSPRLMLSQFQLLNPKEFIRAYKADPSIAKAKMADVAKVAGFTIGMMGLANMAGWEVPLDPDDPKFGMAKKPNSDYAISILPDGLRPQLKFVGRIIKNFSQLPELGLSGSLGETGKDALRYLRSKSSPLLSAVIDQSLPYQKNKFSPPVRRQEELKNRPANLVKAGLEKLSPEAYQWLDRHTRWGYGTDFLNRPVTALDSVTQRLTPIYWNTVYEAFKHQGLTLGEKTARIVPEFFGKATSDYAPTFKRIEIRPGALYGEMKKHGLKAGGVSQREGEQRAEYLDRAERAQQMMNEYGEKLIQADPYRQSPPTRQQAMLRLLEDRITDMEEGEANKKRPTLGNLSPGALLTAVARSEQRKKREAARRQGENRSVPVR